jgi:alkylation response protein AidB-like acyl-CoA dehydrogenase
MTVTATPETGSDLDLVRQKVAQLLRDHPPASTDNRTFLDAQFDAGLAWVHFPVGKGGLGLAANLQGEVQELLAAAGAPNAASNNPHGVSMGAPTLMAWGTPEQQDRYLRPLYNGDERWCQLFSEPGAGSDLAGVALRAVRDGDEWVLNGQKVWNSTAGISQIGMLVARSNPDVPKHQGITYFLLDMHAPGVDVRPLRQMTGEAEFYEVYVTDTRVSDFTRLGPEGAGWKVSVSTLMNERVMLGGHSRTKGPVDIALELYRERRPTDPGIRQRMIDLWIKARLIDLSNERAAANAAAGTPGPEGSTGKLTFSDINQQGTELCLDILGDEAMLYDSYAMREPTEDDLHQRGNPDIRRRFLRARANSIEGGTSEIMRNILGERVLGLPPDVRVDKDRPWSQVPRS